MILHVTFSDGSNPWVSFPTDRHTVAKHWRRWKKYHPMSAHCVAIHGKYRVYYIPNGYILEKGRDFTNIIREYKHLGHALRALERLGGEKP